MAGVHRAQARIKGVCQVGQDCFGQSARSDALMRNVRDGSARHGKGRRVSRRDAVQGTSAQLRGAELLQVVVEDHRYAVPGRRPVRHMQNLRLSAVAAMQVGQSDRAIARRCRWHVDVDARLEGLRREER